MVRSDFKNAGCQATFHKYYALCINIIALSAQILYCMMISTQRVKKTLGAIPTAVKHISAHKEYMVTPPAGHLKNSRTSKTQGRRLSSWIWLRSHYKLQMHSEI